MHQLVGLSVVLGAGTNPTLVAFSQAPLMRKSDTNRRMGWLRWDVSPTPVCNTICGSGPGGGRTFTFLRSDQLWRVPG